MELHICKQCGLVAPKGTTVCPRCGRVLPPTKAEASRPRYTIHVDPDMVHYWDDEDEDEFPLKDDPFSCAMGASNRKRWALALPCNAAVVCHPGGGPYHDDLLDYFHSKRTYLNLPLSLEQHLVFLTYPH